MSGTRPVRRPNGREMHARPERPVTSLTLEKTGPDLGFLFALLSLIGVGLVMMFSTGTVGPEGEELPLKMGLFMAVGLAGMVTATMLPRNLWRRITPWALILCTAALASLLFDSNPLAYGAKGAVRWLQLPGGFLLQPSEFTKLAFVLFGARFLERRGPHMTTVDWVTFLGVLGVLAGLIYKEPDLGTALVLGGTAYFMLIAAGVNWKKLLMGALVAGVIVFMLAWSTDHQKLRLLSWWNPWEFQQEQGYQVVSSWSAIVRGGWTGVGLGSSTAKLGTRLPENNTDFVFAVLVEEMGLLRAFVVLGFFGLLAFRGYQIAARAPDRYTGLLVVGVVSWISIQSVLNLSVVTGTVPNTGVPLPFISYGGSSLVALMTASGLVLGVSRLKRPPGAESERR